MGANCLYGIQSTRLKELESGMTEDVLLDLIKRVTRVTRNQGDKPELEELTGEGTKRLEVKRD